MWGRSGGGFAFCAVIPQKLMHPVKLNLSRMFLELRSRKRKERGGKNESERRLMSFKMCLFTPIISELTLNRIK